MDNQTPTLQFPPVIDSTMRAEFVGCPMAFFRRFIQGYRRTGTSIHLHFGAAFADGLARWRQAVFEEGLDNDSALGLGIGKIIQSWGDTLPSERAPNKTLERCMGALEAYAAQYPPLTDHLRPLIEDGKAAVEYSAAVPLPILHPETGEPLLYSGRFDQLATLQGRGVYGADDKTTTQLGQTWGQAWRLRGQFSGYVWLGQQFGYDIQGFVIRGISILKGSYGHAEVIEQRPQWMIEEWYEQLLRDVRRMVSLWRMMQVASVLTSNDPSKVWDKNLSDTCSSYGGCSFLDPCTSQHPNRWLQTPDFEIERFDPLAKH